MTNTTYNGWTNYETWLANLHFDNFDFQDFIDDGVFDDMDIDDVRIWIADYIENLIDEIVTCDVVSIQNTFINDMLNASIRSIDYRDLADHYCDDVMTDVLKRRDDVVSEG